VFEDVHISDLRTTGAAGWVRAALFKHVKLSGKFGTICVTNDRLDLLDPDPQDQAAFDQAAVDYYRDVDWALDISDARFRALDWRLNVPARLVRRDPATQVIVTRERALEQAWRRILLHPSLVASLEMFVGSGLADTILTAGRASSSFKQEMESLQALRDAAVAEPERH
jgi:hypothetical protein